MAWDWWNGFDGGKTCDTKGYERFIDFAAKNGLEYVVLDWYGYEVRFGFNIWKPCPVVDVDHLVKYAREKGYVHETRKVRAGERIPLHMAPGGGFVARYSRISPKS